MVLLCCISWIVEASGSLKLSRGQAASSVAAAAAISDDVGTAGAAEDYHRTQRIRATKCAAMLEDASTLNKLLIASVLLSPAERIQPRTYVIRDC